MNRATPAWTWHGGNLAAAAAHFGGDPKAWIDLSTGINPAPWPIPRTLAIDWHSLPAPQALAALESTAAGYFGTDPDCVCAVPGSEVGLRLVGQQLGASGPAYALTPGYRTHHAMIEGIRPLPVTNLEAADAATLVLANPTNPDGRRFATADLAHWLERRGTNGWLVLDEAFADVFEEPGLAPRVHAEQRLIVLRSLGKFFGLAGVRLGFVLGPPEFVAALRAMLGSWPLSAAAIAIGEAAYSDHAWIVQTRRRLREQAEALDALLRRCGLEPQGACPLFRMVHHPDAAALFERLARHAILTRPFAQDPTALRLGLPANTAAMTRLEQALQDG
ncbi:threonine-phosphate decarboxylase CobD [Novosphingobium sp. 1949]|uniref:threonine-phosphate decarboxylase n=1 Tax=Novosphingobium organovorum TaxID=2930092 RepID=A0ABT0BFX3_9SPHN|nr:threonine-phosphate decarboxylase CobD [Novosphingobium organovorum]MCJ2183972.1 threonine-phosphate decarboxylase CobD [Novosphingobium organovorum]